MDFVLKALSVLEKASQVTITGTSPAEWQQELQLVSSVRQG